MSTASKSWQKTFGQINWGRVLFVLGSLISIPSLYYLYFVRDEGLLFSLIGTFMVLWAAGLGGFAVIAALGVVAHSLKLLGRLLKPIFRWFMY